MCGMCIYLFIMFMNSLNCGKHYNVWVFKKKTGKS